MRVFFKRKENKGKPRSEHSLRGLYVLCTYADDDIEYSTVSLTNTNFNYLEFGLENKEN